MTPLENKIWNLVSNWAEKQYHPINDMALRGLMDEILVLVNEESKEEQINELVEELKVLSAESKEKFTKYIERDGMMYYANLALGQHYALTPIINKLEKIINNGT